MFIRALAISLAVVFWLTNCVIAAPNAPDGRKLSTSCIRIDGIAIGDSKQKVEKLLGRPNVRRIGTWAYRSDQEFHFRENRVYSIEWGHTLACGQTVLLKHGDGKARVLELLGPPPQTAPSGALMYTFQRDSHTHAFKGSSRRFTLLVYLDSTSDTVSLLCFGTVLFGESFNPH